MKVAVVKEYFPGERRVALVPSAIAPLIKAGLEVVVEESAGLAAGFLDDDYRTAGARIGSRDEVFAAHCLLTVRTAAAAGFALIRSCGIIVSISTDDIRSLIARSIRSRPTRY